MIAPGNHSVITSGVPDETQPAPTKQDVHLPGFGYFAGAAALSNAPIVAWLLITSHLKPAFGVVVGLISGLVVYWSLHLFINRGMDLFIPDVRGRAKVDTGSPAVLLGLLLPLKYLVIGAGLYLLYTAHLLDVPWVAVGFAITQLAVISRAVKRLKSMPLG